MEPTDLSTISAIYGRTVSPINAVGRTLGRVAWNLLDSTGDKEKALRFTYALALLFNLRVRLKPIADKGFYTFFVAQPKDGQFDAERVPEREQLNLTSFRLSQEAVANVTTLPHAYRTLEKFTWLHLRQMIPELPPVPLPMSQFHELLDTFNVHAMGVTGTRLNELVKLAAEVRKGLDTCAERGDVSGLL